MDLKQTFLDSLADSQLGFFYAHENNSSLDDILQDELTIKQYELFMDWRKAETLKPQIPQDVTMAPAFTSIQDTLGLILSELSHLRSEQGKLQKEVEALRKISSISNTEADSAEHETWDTSTVTSGVFSASSEITEMSENDETETLADPEATEEVEVPDYYVDFLPKATDAIADLCGVLADCELDTDKMGTSLIVLNNIHSHIKNDDRRPLRRSAVVAMAINFCKKLTGTHHEDDSFNFLRYSVGYCEVTEFIENDGLFLLRKAITKYWNTSSRYNELSFVLDIYDVICESDPLLLKDEMGAFRMLLEDKGDTPFPSVHALVNIMCSCLEKEATDGELPPNRKIITGIVEKEIIGWELGTQLEFEEENSWKYCFRTTYSNVPINSLLAGWTLANHATLNPETCARLLRDHQGITCLTCFMSDDDKKEEKSPVVNYIRTIFEKIKYEE